MLTGALFIVFVVAGGIAAVLTPVVRDMALRRGLCDDVVSSRKIHVRPTPRVGGLAIVGAFVGGLIATWAVPGGGGQLLAREPAEVACVVLGALAVGALGFLDDVRGVRARVKLVVQLAVAAAVYAGGVRIDVIHLPYGAPIELGPLALPLTMLWIAGVVNAMNLIDGLDGLAGGVAFVAVAALFALGVHRGDAMVVAIATALGGALLGFLLYNFNPASIFMGDSGSMFVGFVLATTAILPDHGSRGGIPVLVPALILGVPLADTTLAMGRRALRGLPVFSADRGHIHHRLLDLGLSQRQTAAVLYGAAAVLGAAGVAVAIGSPGALLFLLALAVVAIVGLRRLGFFHVAKTSRVLAARRRNLEMQSHVRQAAAAMRGARTPEDLWVALRFGAWGLGAAAVALRVPYPRADREMDHGFETHRELLVARFSLDPERQGDTWLELGFADGRARIDRDTEIAVEMLCGDVSSALARLGVRTRRSLAAVEPVRRSGTAA